MKRLGKFSAQIYELEEGDTMPECGTVISDEQANDEKFISKHHAKDLLDCVKCFGCPKATEIFGGK